MTHPIDCAWKILKISYETDEGKPCKECGKIMDEQDEDNGVAGVCQKCLWERDHYEYD